MGWLEAVWSELVEQALKIWHSPEAFVILVSVIGALFGVMMANRTTRRRATIEHLIDTNWDRDYIRAKDRFNVLAKNPESMVRAYELAKTSPDAATHRLAREAREADEPTPEAAQALQRVNEYSRALRDISSIRLMLNHYEVLAIGVREGIIDEPIYRRWFQTGFIRDWEAASDLISRLRKDPDVYNRQAVFIELEELGSRWRSEGLLKRSVKHYRFGGRHIVISRSR